MRKMFLVLLLAGQALAASATFNVPKKMQEYKIPLEWRDGIQWASLQQPTTGEVVKVGLYNKEGPGVPAHSIGMLYDGFSYEGGMYGLGFLTEVVNLCMGQKTNFAEDAAVFVQNSVQRGLSNGSGSFTKIFGKVQYIVATDHYANGRMRIRLTEQTAKNGFARCIF